MFAVTPAVEADAAAILALRHAAEDWLAARGITQWDRRETPPATVLEQIRHGEYFVARRDFTSHGYNLALFERRLRPLET